VPDDSYLSMPSPQSDIRRYLHIGAHNLMFASGKVITCWTEPIVATRTCAEL